jgi:hypothetical protein
MTLPFEICTCTSTGRASMPSKATVATLTTIAPSMRQGFQPSEPAADLRYLRLAPEIWRYYT